MVKEWRGCIAVGLAVAVTAGGSVALASSSSGTAFSIGDGYTYVTNVHVTRGAKTICLHAASGEREAARVLVFDESADLVLLRSVLHSKPLALAAPGSISKGISVLTIGYPVPDIMGIEAKATEGIVNSLTGVQGDRRHIQISAPIQSGNSGGPLLSNSGEVIGVVVARLGRRFTEATGQIAQNVGYAINVSQLRALLESTPSVAKLVRTGGSSPKPSLPRLIEDAEPSVVMVAAHEDRIVCSDDGDREPAAVGVLPPSRSEARRIAEAKRLAIAQADAAERKRRRQEVLDRERSEQEARARRAELQTAQRNRVHAALAGAYPQWSDVVLGPGFAHWAYVQGLPTGNQIIESEDAGQAKATLESYLQLEPEAGDVAGRHRALVRGAASLKGRVVAVDRSLGYAVAEIAGPERMNVNVVLLMNGESKLWQAFPVARSSGNSVSFVTSALGPDQISEGTEILAAPSGKSSMTPKTP